MIAASHPILSCDEAREFEAKLFGGDETREWAAMQSAGSAIAAAVVSDMEEIGGLSAEARLLVLVGKGHNGGDALIAATEILKSYPRARADVVFVFGERALRPLARRAWQEAIAAAGDRWECRDDVRSEVWSGPNYDLCLDGVFGFQFRPPVDERTATLIERMNACSIRFRAAVDLPSANLFRVDFTYATGVVKTSAIESERAGRVRYLDLGFFRGGEKGAARVLTPEILAPIAGWRAPRSDKRSYGHVFVLAGSRNYPGAVLMTVQAALRSGAGLVSAFVPESLTVAFAAQVPEAIWVGCPETPNGGLALEGEHLLRERAERANSLVIGPGMGREPETLALAKSVVGWISVPTVLDADALQPEIVHAAKTTLVLTPHAGEFERVGEGKSLVDFAAHSGATVILKGPITRIVGDASDGERVVYHSLFGGPVLARGGSGDVLAGIMGTMLAQTPKEPLLAAARGAVWQGLAADSLARASGQVAVRTTELLEHLGPALRSAAVRSKEIET
jgi:NAD(P)H-hydrate epimerase